MAITCKWETIVGKVTCERWGETFQLTLYGGGNVYACFCFDSVDENGEKCHTLHDFICDKDHLKNILTNDADSYSCYREWVLNGSIKETWQIAKLLVKYGHNVTIKTEV